MEIQCKKCGKIFKISPSRLGKRSCCSKECFDSLPKTWAIGSIRNKGQVPWNKGIPCREETKQKLSEANKGKASFNGKKHTPEAIRKMSEAKLGKGHTIETRKKMSVSRKGSKNFFWKGGITSDYLLLRGSLECDMWRQEVYKRDNYTCQSCGAKGVKLHAHHIKSFLQYPKLRFEVSNGITLCKKCHEKTDNYGIKTS